MKEIDYLNIWQYHDQEIVRTVKVISDTNDNNIKAYLQRQIHEIYVNNGVNHIMIQVNG